MVKKQKTVHDRSRAKNGSKEFPAKTVVVNNLAKNIRQKTVHGHKQRAKNRIRLHEAKNTIAHGLAKNYRFSIILVKF